MRIPRIVVAAPNSSSGKTTISIGLMGALTAAGHRVAPFKVGPDYIDPGYHTLATGHPGRNLDAWLCGTELITPLLAHGALLPDDQYGPAELSIIEGVMGFLDGRLGVTDGVRGFGSTAHVASLTCSPVVLVADATGVSRTLAATVGGLARSGDLLGGGLVAPHIAGVIINKCGSARAVGELRDAFKAVGLPVLGAVPRSTDLVVPSRHLGLVPAAERDQARAAVDAAASLVAEHVDLDAVLRVATAAPELEVTPWSPVSHLHDALQQAGSVPHPGTRIAVAAGRAFTFRYAETVELFRAAGAEVVEFDPMTDEHLPSDVHGLYLGGGFPEIYAEELAANLPLLEEVRRAVADGVPTWAECAGMLYLCRRLDGMDMAGALPIDATMTPRLTLGYRTLTATTDSLMTRAGEQVNSHEFHRTATTLLDDSLPAAWQVSSPGNPTKTEGLVGANVLACYQHIHPVGAPGIVAGFVAGAHARAIRGRAAVRIATTTGRRPEPDLRHHGDGDLAPGLVDLAVNVHPSTDWLIDEIVEDRSAWGAYPDPAATEAILAAHHAVRPEQVLCTAGGADAFTLIARYFAGGRTTIVHPQFTEPEQAARTSGHQVSRVLLRADDGFRLDPQQIPGTAELVVVGNPTNPTGVLHPAETIASLARPGRTVVVDEAFMDFVDDAPSLICRFMEGILVVRSVTKMWGIPGLRAGYLVGPAELIARLRALQAPWPVSAPALRAMSLIGDSRAADHAAQVRALTATRREVLIGTLTDIGLSVVAGSRAPFILVDASALGDDPVARLAENGFAVRRGDTFPGLGPGWIRVAVRDDAVSAALGQALRRVLG